VYVSCGVRPVITLKGELRLETKTELDGEVVGDAEASTTKVEHEDGYKMAPNVGL
jgi:hypothetical protein